MAAIADCRARDFIQTTWSRLDRWHFEFWLFGMTVYGSWGDGRMVAVSQANAIGFCSR